jgi:hypothetical protein
VVSEPVHGDAVRGYNRGCRCDECRAANTARYHAQRALRMARMEAGELIVAHGSDSTYNNYLCRCDECRRAHSAVLARWRARRKARSARTPERLVADT